MMSKKYPYGEHKQCIFCDKFGTEDNPVFYTEDPYDAEINDDPRLHWICSSCYDDRKGDI